MLKWITAEPIIFIFATINFVNLSIVPQLVLRKLCLRQQNGNETICTSKETTDESLHKEASNWWFVILASGQLPAAITVLIWGPVSDVIGRKKALLAIPVFSILQVSIFVYCAYDVMSHPGYLCIGMFLSSLFGEFPGCMGLACGIIADATSGIKERARLARLAFIDASAILALFPAGIMSGQLVKAYGFLAAFILNIGLNIFLFLYTMFLLPETKAETTETMPLLHTSVESNGKRRIENLGEEGNDISDNVKVSPETIQQEATKTSDLFKPHLQLKKVFKQITAKERRHLILPPLVAFLFGIFGFVGERSTIPLYLKGPPMQFSVDYIGYYIANEGIIRCIGVISVTQLSYRVFNISDIHLIMIGLASHIMSLVLLGFSKSTLSIFLSNIAGFGTQMGFSFLRGYTTKHVRPENYGVVIGAFQSIEALAFTTGSFVSIQVYNASFNLYPGLFFFFLAVCVTISFIITVIYKYMVIRKQTEFSISGNSKN